MLTSWHLNKKGREVCIKATLVSLAFKGQVTRGEMSMRQQEYDVLSELRSDFI